MRLFQPESVSEDLFVAITAIGRLNSFVRSSSCFSGYWKSLHDTVYAVKGFVIQDAHEAGIAFHRRIYVNGKCRKCGGSGWWRSHGDNQSPCWGCSSRGIVTLDFVETKIEIGERVIVWHTPLLSCPYIVKSSLQGIAAVLESDWKPNTPGSDLTTEELAEALNVIESTYAGRLALRVPEWQRRYALKLGSTDAQRCSLCGKAGDTIAYGVSRNLLNWSDHACKECGTKYREHWQSQKSRGPAWVGSIFDAFVVPKSLMTPNVVLWASKRKGLTEYHHCDPMESFY